MPGPRRLGQSVSGGSANGRLAEQGERRELHSKSAEAKSAKAKSFKARSGKAKSSKAKSAKPKSAKSKSAKAKSAKSKSAKSKSASKSAKSKSAESKSAESKSAKAKSSKSKGERSGKSKSSGNDSFWSGSSKGASSERVKNTKSPYSDKSVGGGSSQSISSNHVEPIDMGAENAQPPPEDGRGVDGQGIDAQSPGLGPVSIYDGLSLEGDLGARGVGGSASSDEGASAGEGTDARGVDDSVTSGESASAEPGIENSRGADGIEYAGMVSVEGIKSGAETPILEDNFAVERMEEDNSDIVENDEAQNSRSNSNVSLNGGDQPPEELPDTVMANDVEAGAELPLAVAGLDNDKGGNTIAASANLEAEFIEERMEESEEVGQLDRNKKADISMDSVE